MKDTQKIIIFNLILIFCLTAFMKVKAESDSTALSLKITNGSLSVAAPESATFTGTDFSFTGQTSGNNSIGNIQTTDARGNRAGWGINITASDWQDSSNPAKTMKYNGDGVSEGQLALDVPEITGVASLAGDGVTGMTMGQDAAFGASAIKLITAPAGYGSGQYDISGLNASQYIPGNQQTGDYVTTLTLTIS